ncbi:esterase/lipase family protein [Nocardia sp. NPDC059240]|uniref:esterase/lipase family protein n=1 Tax=Nocardia sp. NPDC059240 TaxID=3346786 RepID=UPI003680DA49
MQAGTAVVAALLLLGATPAAAMPEIAPADQPTAGTLEPTLDCTPDPEQPNPVVILGGFGAVGDIRATLEKQMAGITGGIRGIGGCPFIFGYGIIGPMQAAAPVSESAGQLRDFVAKVRAATGAAKVDIVAHSSGALIANYYLKFLHGGSSVDRAVYLAPVTKGTTAATLIGGLDLPGSPEGLAGVLNDATNPLRDTVFRGVRGALDCLAGSTVTTELLAGGVTVPEVSYSVLATRGDQVLTPPGVASFIEEPGVVNDYFEDLYPRAGVASHAALPMQPDAAEWVVEQLLSE